MATLTDNWLTYYPPEGGSWSYRDLGIEPYTPQIPPTEPILAQDTWLPGEVQVTSQTRQELTNILAQPVRGIQPTEFELYLADLQRRASTQADLFAELLLQPVGGKKAVKKTLKGVAQQLVRRAQLARYIPGVGIAVEVAADAAAMLDLLSEVSQEAALGRMRFPGYRTKQGPQTRPRNRPKTQPQRERATKTKPIAQPSLSPAPLITPEPSVTIAPAPVPTPSPLGDVGPAPEPPAKPARAGTRPRPPSYAPSPSPGPSPSPLFRWLTQAAPSLTTGAISAIESLATPEVEPLTKTQPDGAESPPDRCQCEKTKDKPKRKRKPRTVCYRGTYTEKAKGLSKHRREQIPCQ